MHSSLHAPQIVALCLSVVRVQTHAVTRSLAYILHTHQRQCKPSNQCSLLVTSWAKKSKDKTCKNLRNRLAVLPEEQWPGSMCEYSKTLLGCGMSSAVSELSALTPGPRVHSHTCVCGKEFMRVHVRMRNVCTSRNMSKLYAQCYLPFPPYLSGCG